MQDKSSVEFHREVIDPGQQQMSDLTAHVGDVYDEVLQCLMLDPQTEIHGCWQTKPPDTRLAGENAGTDQACVAASGAEVSVILHRDIGHWGLPSLDSIAVGIWRVVGGPKAAPHDHIVPHCSAVCTRSRIAARNSSCMARSTT